MTSKGKKIFTNLTAYILVIVLSVAFILIGSRGAYDNLNTTSDSFYKAEVISLKHVDTEEIASETEEGEVTVASEKVYFDGRMKNGPHKGKTVTMMQHIDFLYSIRPEVVKPGDEIVIAYTMDPTGTDEVWLFINYDRTGGILAICLIFLALIILIGRKKGIATIGSLLFTMTAIFMVYIPSILGGRNIYLITVIIAIYIIFMSLVLINGVNKKTLCAIIGNIGGVAVAGLLALLTNHLLGITGVVDEDSLFLMYINSAKPLDLRAVVWGSIVIGSLGAVMDVAMSLASAMNEISETMEKKSIARMVRSGMNIGKDAIGTMTNTLILAYVGGSLATVLLLVASNQDPLCLFNTEMIMVEVLQGVVGSTGILFAVPVTVIVSAYLYNRREKNKKL